MKKIYYGILSTAQIVPRFVEGIKKSRAGQVAAIASRSLAKAEQMASELAIPKAYGSYEELCKDEEIDIIYVATYNKGHYEAAKMALKHRKHVLVEKPFTLQAAQAKELFELAEKNNCFLMEAQKSVFLPISLQVKEAIKKNKIGQVYWVQAVTTYPSVDHISWFHSLEAGGGTLHGSGSYPIQYMQFLLDQPVEESSGCVTRKAGATDDQVNLALKFQNQTLANVFISVKLDIPSKMTIYGEKGRIEIPYFWKTKEATIYYEDGCCEPLTGEFESEFIFEVEHVNECLQKQLRESPVMTKQLTIDTVSLVERLYGKWLEKEEQA
ncbi:Gfo/Idh/MocA family protein [Enterococcus caccae]|uniref:Gfo/Idh/MocA family oxidoreductase n=1 Tax=Enterococcus caccae ATCC BAA-1240 TaxID=1158612 RepID=R3WNQ0_9ENTE|nr:Gfo/Idh/MocA family oxidoreductase [Enterococcus caccae]EOL49052.1 gfo/Idh/MocA family oxidoreductase [Enterococcus caccae ATCC BAA-1240]EOT65445.1 gfo/Idh/MocA family oxidoreductase [Enterococcus caccae ATCC BAA-1240]OJG25087.1 gfo/Idh/MocA family oxidoreductase [Enterococcus caccae]